MYRLNALLLILSAFLCLNPLYAEQTRAPLSPETLSGWAMEMPYEIAFSPKVSEKEKKNLEEKVSKIFEKVHTIFSNYNSDSEISQVNRAKAHVTIKVSKELYGCLEFCKKAYAFTEGRFDPSAGRAIRAWKKALAEGRILSTEEIEKLKSNVGLDKLTLKDGAITKAADHLEIDLGGVAKGLAVDWIKEMLQAEGLKSGFVNWSGEIAVFGKHPEGRAWRVMIPANAFANAPLELEEGAIATSGDYLQNWQVAVKDKVMTYSHIIDPATLMPLEVRPGNISSVSVFAPTCQLSDVLATSAMFLEDTDTLSCWIKKVKAHYPKVHFWTLKRKAESKL